MSTTPGEKVKVKLAYYGVGIQVHTGTLVHLYLTSGSTGGPFEYFHHAMPLE